MRSRIGIGHDERKDRILEEEINCNIFNLYYFCRNIMPFMKIYIVTNDHFQSILKSLKNCIPLTPNPITHTSPYPTLLTKG
jgi:hypothetical protein